MKTISRYLMTLVALFAMTTGAWADEATITLKCGTTEKTYENVTLPWSTTAEILKAVVTDINFNININAISGGDGKVVKYGNENFTVTGTFSGEATVTVTYNMGSSATITVTAPGSLLTLSEDGTTATMESMPASDLTVDYELVRDMEVDVNAYVGTDANTTYRHRVQKVDANTYSPVGITTDAQLIALFPVIDVIDAQNPKTLTYGTDYTVTIIDADKNEIAIGEFNFAPGTYSVKVTGKGDYDGQIASENSFVLYQGYEVEVPAQEYITYYSAEPVRVDQTEQPFAEIYTISEVGETTATLSGPLDAMKANKPMLVYNNSTETQHILLIPCNEPDVLLSVAKEFVGTTTATSIPASTSSESNYAFNGKDFVWVKNEIAIGANKCWISITKASSVRSITLVNNSPTAIGATLVNSEEVNSEEWFDLNGRKVNKPTKKGIYIKNGQKVVIK